MNRLKEKYSKEVVPALTKEFGYKNVMESVKNIFAVSELRKRVLFTLGLLGVYRLGHVITVPGVNRAAIDELARQMANNMSRWRMH